MASLIKPKNCTCGSINFHRLYTPERWICDECEIVVVSRKLLPDQNACGRCGVPRGFVKFINQRNICVTCDREYKRVWGQGYRKTVNGRLQNLLDRAKRSQGRNRKIFCDLTFQQLLQSFIKQDGKCAITHMKMTTETNDPLCVSIDRIDSASDYTLSNILLVCRWVNLARGTYPLVDFKNRVLDPLLSKI